MTTQIRTSAAILIKRLKAAAAELSWKTNDTDGKYGAPFCSRSVCEMVVDLPPVVVRNLHQLGPSSYRGSEFAHIVWSTGPHTLLYSYHL